MMDSAKRHTFLIAKIGGVVILLMLAFAGCVLYSFRSAKKDAEMFCTEIAVGSNIAAAAARAKQRKILYGPGDEYVFIFPTLTGFDKAVCNVWVDKEGKVVSKSWEMEYD